MITVNWPTQVINIPQADLTLVSGALYELNVNTLRLALKDLEDDEDGQVWPTTHAHNTELVLSGVTYARSVEIINGYTVEFEDAQYAVRLVGANHNIADVKVANQVSLIIGNSAGLIAVGGASPWTEVLDGGFTAAEIMRLLVAVMAGKSNGGGTANESHHGSSRDPTNNRGYSVLG
jgi:hypothetical protein